MCARMNLRVPNLVFYTNSMHKIKHALIVVLYIYIYRALEGVSYYYNIYILYVLPYIYIYSKTSGCCTVMTDAAVKSLMRSEPSERA